MTSHKSSKRLRKTEYLRHSRRLLALLLCLCTTLSLLGSAFSSTVWAVEYSVPDAEQEQTFGTYFTEDVQDELQYPPQNETHEEIKDRLLRQIKEEGWDPYSANMTLDEFYALMELFQEGVLPLASDEQTEEMPDNEMPDASDLFGEPSLDDPDFGMYGYDEPGIDDPDFGMTGYDEPSLDDPDFGMPEYDEPGIDDPDFDMPRYDEPGLEDSDFYDQGIDDPADYEPGFEEPIPQDGETEVVDEEILYIPRNMFMFGGLSDYTGTENAPLGYNNLTGSDEPDYPAGLDPYGMGYMRPPMGWNGVALNKSSQSLVIVPGKNNGNDNVAGDVDQSLFLAYSGYYVRRVTAQNTEATILGAVKLPNSNTYVYYYLTDDQQSTEVSTTTLPEGQKFIIQYVPIEHKITYEVRMGAIDGVDITDKWENVNVNSTDITARWEEIVFGTDHPVKTDEGGYSFTAWAPYGYTVELYLIKHEVPSKTILELGKDKSGDYKEINGGWALGKEPDYFNGNPNGAHVYPSTNGPDILTISGTFHEDSIRHERTVVAVVTKNPDPMFLVAPIKYNTANVSSRGTSAYTQVKTKDGNYVTYDYEDVYRWAKGLGSEYVYDETDDTIKGAGKDNIAKGNIATCDGWGWSNKLPYNNTVNMNKEDDGTYSYQWTFQTNSTNNYVLDILEINGVGMNIPYYAKQALDPIKFQDEAPGTDGGLYTWYTEADLANGIHVKAEYLMGFPANSYPYNPQRVYRITVTGARSNVTINGMNLMQYATGADEFATYQLDGITGATLRADSVGNGTHTAAIQYYNNATAGWSENIPQGTVVVKDNGYIDDNGDKDMHGANIRFKLADGYDSPYYLWESTKRGIIDGTDGLPQASIERKDDGNVNYSTMQKTRPLSELSEGEKMDSQHIYIDDDGWCYIRVTTQGQHKIALLTIVARPVRYVVRYVPTAASSSGFVGAVGNPENMPFFDHSYSHESFDFPNAWQYDDKDGAYYDTAVDTVIRLPSSVPSDPKNKCCFVDWVLVDQNFNPVWAWTNGKGDSVQITTDSKGNRILVDITGTHPALLNENYELYIDYNYTLNWNGTAYDLIDISGNEYQTLTNWVLLNRDGKLVYASTGELVVIPDDSSSEVTPEPPSGDEPGGFAEADDEEGDDKQKYKEWDGSLSGWYVRDANGSAAEINSGSEFHYRSNTITLADINQYAVPNDELGGNSTDIYVVRLMPVWENIINPFHYRVALNWLDAQGKLHEEYFADYWQDVLTDWDINSEGALTVKVITDSKPFMDWVAQHPTYSFWDEVNNAMSEDAIITALDEYIKTLSPIHQKLVAKGNETYNNILEALKRLNHPDPETGEITDIDDFTRGGNYTYYVNEDYGTIVVWCYEIRGGMVFREQVDQESFSPDDEFYYTITGVKVTDSFGQVGSLNGTYRAYPEHTGVYESVTDAEGNQVLQEVFKDYDAWLVNFKDGSVRWIIKNDGTEQVPLDEDVTAHPENYVTWFTLKNGEGIKLYVPEGMYTIVELGSKSGGSYRSYVEYQGIYPKEKNWTIPSEDEENWLKGSNKKVSSGKQEGQILATVDFLIGSYDVVQTLTFHNQTSTVAIEPRVVGPYDGEAFEYNTTFILKDVDPLYDEDGKYYYFNFNLYNVKYAADEEASDERPPQPEKPVEPTYDGGIMSKPNRDDYLNSDGTFNYEKWNEDFEAYHKWKNDYQEWRENDEAYQIYLKKYEEYHEWLKWKPAGTLTAQYTGRLVVEKIYDSGDGRVTWVGKYLLAQKEVRNTETGEIDTVWERLKDPSNKMDGIWLKAGNDAQRIYVVCTAPREDEEINYIIQEMDDNGYPLMGKEIREHIINPADLAYDLFIHSRLDILPATGGVGTVWIRLFGGVLIFLALALYLRVRKRRLRSD